MFRWGFLKVRSVEKFVWAKHLFIKNQRFIFCSRWEEPLLLLFFLIWSGKKKPACYCMLLLLLTRLFSAASLHSFSQMYNHFWVTLLRISMTQEWPFISEADEDSRVLMRTSSVRSSGCDEPSEMSNVKSTMSFSLIKDINYANYFENGLDRSTAESHDNLLMSRLFLIQL